MRRGGGRGGRYGEVEKGRCGDRVKYTTIVFGVSEMQQCHDYDVPISVTHMNSDGVAFHQLQKRLNGTAETRAV